MKRMFELKTADNASIGRKYIAIINYRNRKFEISTASTEAQGRPVRVNCDA